VGVFNVDNVVSSLASHREQFLIREKINPVPCSENMSCSCSCECQL